MTLGSRWAASQLALCTQCRFPVSFSLLLLSAQWHSEVAKPRIGFYSRSFVQGLYSHARGFYSQREVDITIGWWMDATPFWSKLQPHGGAAPAGATGTPSCHFRLAEAEVVG